MGKAAYPTATDLTAFLEEAGLTDVAALDLTTAALAGRQAVERDCGRVFLAAAGTRTFDPPTNPSGILDLGADLVSVSALTYGGAALADYRLLRSAPAEPAWGVQFRLRWYSPLAWSLQNSLSITGQWGYAAVIPEDAWTAMLARGALSRQAQLAQALSGGIIAYTEGDVTKRWGEKPLEGLSAGWKSLVEAAVNRYRRVTVGL